MKISQKRLNYTVTDSGTSQSGDGTGHDAALNFYDQIHLVRDWSAVNRRGLSQTTGKGNPYVFGVNVTATGSRIPGSGDTGADESLSDDAVANSLVTIRFYAPQNTWVYKRAAIKLHAARKKMLAESGIKASQMGAYAKTIRYALESNSESYLVPVSTTSRSAIAGGTWDHTQIFMEGDNSGTYISLCGSHASEEGTSAFTNVFLPQLYLSSRGTMAADTNLETSVTPTVESILLKMLAPQRGGVTDAVKSNVRGEQDNPPYDLTVAGGDASDLVEIGRIQFNPYTAGKGGCYLEIPFGVVKMSTQILDHADSDANLSLDMSFECTGIAEM